MPKQRKVEIVIPGVQLRDAEMGPDMLALNDRQRAFVFHLVEAGGMHPTRAAMKAGYAGSEESIRVQASRMVHDRRIAAAMHEEAKRRLHATTLLAVSELHRIITDESVKTAQKLTAIAMVLNRVGLPANQTHTVEHKHTATDEEQIQNIVVLANQLGLDPGRLLGSAGVTIDGTVTHLTPAQEAEILSDDETREDW